MMRKTLLNLSNERKDFIGTVTKFGRKTSKYGTKDITLLLEDVKLLSGQIVSDHIWVTYGSWAGNIKLNDIIQFTATIYKYNKGGYIRQGIIKRKTSDYGLKNIKNVQIIQRKRLIN